MKPSLAILDVGHGNSAIVHTENSIIIIDAGPGSSLLHYLTELGINSISTVLLSHADKDHIEGLVVLLASGLFSIGRVRVNSDALKDSALWDDLLYELGQAAQRGKIDFVPALTSTQTGEFDQDGIGIEILAPSPYLAAKGPGTYTRDGRRLTSNSISAVIRITKNQIPVALLTADLDDIGLDELIAAKVDISAPLIVFPHHGGNAGSHDLVQFSRKFCNLINPETIIFSIGRESYENPHPELIAEIRKKHPNARIMCTQLSIHCAAALPKESPSHLHNSFSRGQEQRKCCAGTVVIDLRKTTKLFPAHSAHGKFVTAHARKALCQKKKQ